MCEYFILFHYCIAHNGIIEDYLKGITKAVVSFIMRRIMAKEFAGNFYKTQKWKNVRDYVKKKYGGLCKMCLDQGIYRPAEIVHHTVFLNEDNIHDESITLNEKLLIPLCRKHHALVHEAAEKRRRYIVDENGNVTISPICEKI